MNRISAADEANPVRALWQSRSASAPKLHLLLIPEDAGDFAVAVGNVLEQREHLAVGPYRRGRYGHALLDGCCGNTAASALLQVHDEPPEGVGVLDAFQRQLRPAAARSLDHGLGDGHLDGYRVEGGRAHAPGGYQLVGPGLVDLDVRDFLERDHFPYLRLEVFAVHALQAAEARRTRVQDPLGVFLLQVHDAGIAHGQVYRPYVLLQVLPPHRIAEILNAEEKA